MPHRRTFTRTADEQGLAPSASRLILSAAEHLGIHGEIAHRVARTATFAAGDKTLFVLPMAMEDEGRLSLVITVQTCIPIDLGAGAADVVRVLQHAPAALHALSSSIGCSTDGRWLVCRSVCVAMDDGGALAHCLLETLNLADFVLADRSRDGH